MLISSGTTKSSGKKGRDGEDLLYDILSTRLKLRDGYTVEKVNGLSHNCDMVVKREKYPSVRIESKAIGQQTGAKVSSRDVEKFQRDLLQVNDHGIFISLYSEISGVSNFEVQQLANGKFAIYLSNVLLKSEAGDGNCDGSVVLEMLQLVYTLDRISMKGDGNDSLVVSIDSMKRVQSYLKDFNNKIQSAKMHLKDTMSILSEIQMDMIEKVLLGQKAEAEGCLGTPGSSPSPSLALGHAIQATKKKRASSAYNIFIGSKITELKKERPEINNGKEYMRLAIDAWQTKTLKP
jgi:hypothetical protein